MADWSPTECLLVGKLSQTPATNQRPVCDMDACAETSLRSFICSRLQPRHPQARARARAREGKGGQGMARARARAREGKSKGKGGQGQEQGRARAMTRARDLPRRVIARGGDDWQTICNQTPITLKPVANQPPNSCKPVPNQAIFLGLTKLCDWS